MKLRMTTDRDFYPRWAVRPPKPNRIVPTDLETGRAVRSYTREEHDEQEKLDYAWRRSWKLVYEGPALPLKRYLDESWEIRAIELGELIEPTPDFNVSEQKRRARLEKLADMFLTTGGSFLESVTLETREAALAIVAARLREVAADGFLLDLLVRSHEQAVDSSAS